MTTQNHIEGVLSLTSPLHCSSESYTTADGKSVNGTVTQPIVGPKGVSRVPYFPANDIRGRLRRKAAAILVNHLTAEGSHLSVDLLSGLLCGAVSANGENDVSVEEVLRARSNVYMGVFGGGTRLMRSGMKVHDALPFLEETVSVGAVPDYMGVDIPMDVYRSSDKSEVATPLRGYKLVHTIQSIRSDDVYRVVNLTLLEQGLADTKAEVTDHQLAVLAGNAKRKEDKTINKKTTLANIMNFEAMAIGTKLHFRIDMEDHLTDAQKGLILMSVLELMNEQALGGLVRHGFGRFNVDQMRGVFNGNNVDDNGNPNSVIAFNEKTGLYELQGVAATYAEAAVEEISKLTIDDMWLFFKPMKEAA